MFKKTYSLSLSLGLILFLLVLPSNAQAATYTVTKTADTNDGACDADCSLREAIAAANGNAGHDTIEFNIPESDPGYVPPDEDTHGYFLISTSTGTITISDNDGVFINGYSQPGSQRNTAAFGETLDTTLKIQWYASNTSGDNIRISASNNHITGLNIKTYRNHQNSINTGTGGNNWFEGNFFGTDIAGLDTSGGGIFYLGDGPGGNTFGTNGDGTEDRGEFNLFGSEYITNGWRSYIHLGTQSNNIIAGNYLGPNKTGRVCTSGTHSGAVVWLGGINNRVGTNYDGISDEEEANIIGCLTVNEYSVGLIRLYSSNTVIQGNYFGVSPHGDQLGSLVGRNVSFLEGRQATSNIMIKGNVIGGNTDFGIWHGYANSIGSTFRQNKIYGAAIKNIRLTGVTPYPNDPGDLDTGPNDLMNYPIIESAEYLGGGKYMVSGVLDGNPSEAPYVVEVCKSSGHSTNHGGCSESLGLVTVEVPGSWSMEVTTGDEGVGGYPVFTSLATNRNGSTSEFGPNFRATGGVSVSQALPPTSDFTSLKSGIVEKNNVMIISLPNTFNMEVVMDVEENKKTGAFRLPNTNLWQAGSMYEVRFKSLFNNFELSKIDFLKPVILSLKYDPTSLESTLPEKNLKLAYSIDNKTWKIILSVLNLNNKTIATVTKSGGYYMLVSGY